MPHLWRQQTAKLVGVPRDINHLIIPDVSDIGSGAWSMPAGLLQHRRVILLFILSGGLLYAGKPLHLNTSSPISTLSRHPATVTAA
jgi:hypothetical protein